MMEPVDLEAEELLAVLEVELHELEEEMLAVLGLI